MWVLFIIYILYWSGEKYTSHTQSVIIFYSYEFDEDDFEEEIMPIPKKRAALKNVQEEKEVVEPEAKKAKKAKPEAKKAALKNVQEEQEKEVVKPEAAATKAAKPPAKKKGRKK